MTTESIVLRTEQDGVEFYTIAETGESGMSQSGLARFCGVGESAIRKLLEGSRTKTGSKWLQSIASEDQHLRTEYQKEGGMVKIIRAEVCAAIIQHYAFGGNVIAQYALEKFSTGGINGFIQNVNHWQPQAEQASPEIPPIDFDKFIAENQHRISEIKRSKTGVLTVKFEKAAQHHKAVQDKTETNWGKGELPYHLARVIQISKNKEAKSKDAWISTRDIVTGISGKNRPNVYQARQWMSELEKMGKGITRVSGLSLEWHYTPDVD